MCRAMATGILWWFCTAPNAGLKAASALSGVNSPPSGYRVGLAHHACVHHAKVTWSCRLIEERASLCGTRGEQSLARTKCREAVAT